MRKDSGTSFVTDLLLAAVMAEASVTIDHTEELYFSFFAAKCYVTYLFPLETIHLFEPVH